MSTELLARRMDLLHSFDEENQVNLLKMDTSYPVKLSGIVVKVFKAVTNYSHSDYDDEHIIFSIRNENDSDTEFVADIKLKNAFTFSGRKLVDDEYVTGDYVIAVIDLNDNVNGNAKIFINSLKNAQSPDNNERTMDYHCNGVNDNVVLGQITNILIDLYDYSQDISSNDEFDLTMTNDEHRSLFEDSQFTINIIGRFGIDYSSTDFVYGGFNRQNRSTLMKISGTNPDRERSLEWRNDDMDFDLIMDWGRCTIPKIIRNNETYAAMYNVRIMDKNKLSYYDYWSEEFTPHFVDSEGNAYGNLFPRRLVFMSIEGAIPINLTIKNLNLTTFGVGIYCETESEKTIKLIDSKITITNGVVMTPQIPSSDAECDIRTNPDFYRYGYIHPGCAVDINCYKADTIISNCTIKTARGNSTGELILNSSHNMKITNSKILGFNGMMDSYKYAYTVPYLDYEYSPAFNYSVPDEFKEETYIGYNLTNKIILGNILASLTAYNYHGGGTGVMTPDGHFVANKLYFPNATPYSNYEDIDGTDFASVDLQSKTISYKTPSLTDNNSTTLGVIKNIQYLFRDIISSDSKFYLDYIKGQNPTTEPYAGTNASRQTIANMDSACQPVLFINNTDINALGILYQTAGKVYVTNSTLKSQLYDLAYVPNPITLIGGILTLDGVEGTFDTRTHQHSKFGGRGMVSDLSFIRIPQIIYDNDKTARTIIDNNNKDKVYSYILPRPSVIPTASAKLNLIGTTLTIHPDINFMIPVYENYNYNISDDNLSIGGLIYSVIPGSNIVDIREKAKNNTHDINSESYRRESSMNAHTLSFIRCDNNDDYSIGGIAGSGKSNRYNPQISPIINIESSQLIVGNSNNFADYVDSNSTDILPIAMQVKAGKNILNKINNDTTRIVTDDFESINIISLADMEGDGKYSNKYNIFLSSNSSYVKALDMTTGSVYTYSDLTDGVFTKSSKNEFSISGSNLNKFYHSGFIFEYETIYNIARINGELSCTNYAGKVTHPNGDIMGKRPGFSCSDFEDHIFIAPIYEEDLIHRNGLTSCPNGSNNDIGIGNGVCGIVAKNATLNVSNTTIGGSAFVGSRNAYNMETFLKHSPKNAIVLMNSVNATISGCKLSSVGNVISTSLKKSSNKYRYDYTSLNLENHCSVNIANSLLINSNASRVMQTNEDWMDYYHDGYFTSNGDKINQHIFDKGNLDYDITNANSKVSMRQARTTDWQGIKYDDEKDFGIHGYSESVRNFNEDPIIYIDNDENCTVSINGCTILGNEISLHSGSLDINDCVYVNNGNAMMCVVDPRAYYLNVRDSRITCIKDMVNDIYIDKDRLRDFNTLIYHVNDCTYKGMDKYNNVLTAFYIKINEYLHNTFNHFNLSGNTIVMKQSNYRDMYGISNDTKVRTVYIDGKFTSDNIKFDINDNDITMMFDCPILTTSNETLRPYKVIPDSINLSAIEMHGEVRDSGSDFNITRNKFDIITLINQELTTYCIKQNKSDINGNIVSTPSFYPSRPFDIYMIRKTETTTASVTLTDMTSIDPSYKFIADEEELSNYGTVTSFVTKTEQTSPLLAFHYSKRKGTLIENDSKLISVDTLKSLDEYTETYQYRDSNNTTITYPAKIKSNTVTDWKISDSGVLSLISTTTLDTYYIDYHSADFNNVDFDKNLINYFYTGFNTPIIYSNCPLTLNLSGNTIVNDDTIESLTRKLGWNTSNENYTIMKSPTYMDINGFTQRYRRAEYSNDGYTVKGVSNDSDCTLKRITIDNNILTSDIPSNIVIRPKSGNVNYESGKYLFVKVYEKGVANFTVRGKAPVKNLIYRTKSEDGLYTTVDTNSYTGKIGCHDSFKDTSSTYPESADLIVNKKNLCYVAYKKRYMGAGYYSDGISINNTSSDKISVFKSIPANNSKFKLDFKAGLLSSGLNTVRVNLDRSKADIGDEDKVYSHLLIIENSTSEYVRCVSPLFIDPSNSQIIISGEFPLYTDKSCSPSTRYINDNVEGVSFHLDMDINTWSHTIQGERKNDYSIPYYSNGNTYYVKYSEIGDYVDSENSHIQLKEDKGFVFFFKPSQDIHSWENKTTYCDTADVNGLIKRLGLCDASYSGSSLGIRYLTSDELKYLRGKVFKINTVITGFSSVHSNVFTGNCVVFTDEDNNAYIALNYNTDAAHNSFTYYMQYTPGFDDDIITTTNDIAQTISKEKLHALTSDKSYFVTDLPQYTLDDTTYSKELYGRSIVPTGSLYTGNVFVGPSTISADADSTEYTKSSGYYYKLDDLINNYNQNNEKFIRGVDLNTFLTNDIDVSIFSDHLVEDETDPDILTTLPNNGYYFAKYSDTDNSVLSEMIGVDIITRDNIFHRARKRGVLKDSVSTSTPAISLPNHLGSLTSDIFKK